MSEIYCKKCGGIIRPTDLICRKCGSLSDRLRYIALLLTMVLLISAILLIAISAIFHTEDFVIFTSPYGSLIPWLLFMVALPFYFIGINIQGMDEHKKFTPREIMVLCLLFISLISITVLPFILVKRSESVISRYLRDMDLYTAIAVWPDYGGEQPANNINLAGLSPLRSAVIVNGPSFDFQGVTMKVSEFNDLLPDETRAFGTQNLRYVLDFAHFKLNNRLIRQERREQPEELDTGRGFGTILCNSNGATNACGLRPGRH
jgi:hypothetical protein